MKKILYLLPALLMMLIGCNKDADSGSLTVSFETKMAIYSENVATISVVSNYKGDDPIEVPVDFSGSAVKGEDYDFVAGDKFILGGTKPVTNIDINFLKVGNNKELRAQLVIPENMKQGKYSTIIIESPVISTFVSFETNSQTLFDKSNIKIITVDGVGQYKRMSRDIHIKVKVDKDKSTAVEGENFAVKEVENNQHPENGKKETKEDDSIKEEYDVLIPEGQFYGYLSLNTIGTHVDNKDKIVLALSPTETMGIGQYRQTRVGILTIDEVLPGKWKLEKFDSDKESMIKSWGDEYKDDFEGYPEENKEDSFEIKDGKFIPDFKSDFKNYFIGVSDFVKAPDIYYPFDKRTNTYLYVLEPYKDVYRYILNNVNRDFSAKSQSEDKEAVIAIKLLSENTLVLFIVDYVPTTFLQPFKEWGFFEPDYERRGRYVRRKTEKPYVTTSGAYLIATFTRAAEDEKPADKPADQPKDK